MPNTELDPKWRYDTVKNFTRDAQTALSDLVFRNWQQPRLDNPAP